MVKPEAINPMYVYFECSSQVQITISSCKKLLYSELTCLNVFLQMFATMYPEKRQKFETNGSEVGCFNSVVQPLLTDLYQITMAYAYWKSGKANNVATFDLFFRKSPFKGEFTIFAGLSDCIKFLETFRISQSDIDYLKTVIPDCEPQFFDFLQNIRPDHIKIEALKEGSICFPKIPLMKVTGPLIMVQLLETVFLTLIN